MYSKVTGIIFSATDNTKKYVKAMAEATALPFGMIDVTTDRIAVTKEFGKDDLVIIGAPVYGGRIPTVAKERFTNISGNGTECIIVACYGNRHYDDALAEMSDMMTEKGFIVKAAAAVIGRHTFGEIAIDRPNSDDIAEAKSFIKNVLSKDSHENVSVPGNRPYKDGGSGGKFRPVTTDDCFFCGLCVAQCPVGAISSDCKTISDACISCFRCIRNCPVGAKQPDSEGYPAFAESFTAKLSARRENEFFI